jgi:hypothetical protein
MRARPRTTRDFLREKPHKNTRSRVDRGNFRVNQPVSNFVEQIRKTRQVKFDRE